MAATRVKTLLRAIAVCFTTVGFAQTTPTPLMSVKEGVYAFNNLYSTTVIELKGGEFRYWFRSDMRSWREPDYPLVGSYTTNGGTVTLLHKEILQTNWTFMAYEGKTTLWRPSALKDWDETKKVD